MKGDPLPIPVKAGAKPVAIHTPVPVPMHWEDQVYKDLMRDVALGVIEPVPVNTPVTWCSRMIIGRDHAGVGDYYGPFDAQEIFNKIPQGSLELKPLNIDWTFYCFKCRGMASMRTCPHGKEDRLLLSGTMLRKTLSEGGEVPADFSRPEVLKILEV